MHAVSFANSSFKHQNIVLHAVLLILLYVSNMNGHHQDYMDINIAATCMHVTSMYATLHGTDIPITKLMENNKIIQTSNLEF